MFLASRGLREEDDGRTRARLAQEHLVAVQGQARKVWTETVVTAVAAGAAAVLWAALR